MRFQINLAITTSTLDTIDELIRGDKIPASEQDLDIGRNGAHGFAPAATSRMHVRNSELTADVIAGRNALHDM